MAVAVHAIGFLAFQERRASTSEEIARSVDTHPVAIRRLLARLREAGIVDSHSGPGGGWHLAKPAREITLGAIYRAVEHESLFTLPAQPARADCEVGPRVAQVLKSRFDDAEAVLIDHLDRQSMVDVIVDVATLIGPCPLSFVEGPECDLPPDAARPRSPSGHERPTYRDVAMVTHRVDSDRD